MRLSILLLLAWAINVSPAASQSRNYPPEFLDARSETYKEIDDVALKLWVFDPPNHKPSDQRPAIIFFFGGGWRAGSPAQFEQQCRYFSSQGMVAITADYRVLQRHKTMADKCVSDAKSAIRWVREHADRLGIDPDRIVAAGGSAGGHLAACAGVLSGLDEAGENLKVSSVPNAMALFNPAVLLAPFDGVALDEEKLGDIATRTGVKPEEISPIHHLRKGLPPTIIFHGEADPTVPFATVAKYSKVASDLGNRCELAAYPDAVHGFFNYGRNGKPGEYYLQTVSRLHEFLHQLGYLDGSPTLVPKSKNIHLRSHLDHSLTSLRDKQDATVAFIGGSITEMAGYRVMVEEYLTQRFPDTHFTFINAGIASTCSTTGAFRLARDVLSASPDLLFVEFAVNDDQDAGHAERECRRGMEGILRAARMSNPSMDIVVTHFVNPPMLEQFKQGQTPLSSGAHEAVAQHYGVSTIDLAREVAEQIEDGRLTWKVYGGTHPAEAGNRIAADMISDLLETAWANRLDETTPQEARVKQALPKLLDRKSYARGQLLDVAKAVFDSGWSHERPDWGSIKGSLRGRFNQAKLLCSEKVGAELKLKFKGTAIGLFVLAGPDAGSVEYSIDDSEPRSVDLYHRFSKNLHYPRTVMLDADLSDEPHELTLRVSKQHHAQSQGNAIRILDFVTN